MNHSLHYLCHHSKCELDAMVLILGCIHNGGTTSTRTQGHKDVHLSHVLNTKARI